MELMAISANLYWYQVLTRGSSIYKSGQRRLLLKLAHQLRSYSFS